MGLLYAHLDGGRDTFLDGIAFAANESPLADRFLTGWYSLSDEVRHTVAIENVCLAMGISVNELVAVVTESLAAHLRTAADLVANSALPSVVRQLAKSAQRIGGEYADISHKDRVVFLQSQKFVPTAKGPMVQVNANAAAASYVAGPSVPSFLEDIRSAVTTKDVVQGQLLAARRTLEDEE